MTNPPMNKISDLKKKEKKKVISAIFISAYRENHIMQQKSQKRKPKYIYEVSMSVHSWNTNTVL